LNTPLRSPCDRRYMPAFHSSGMRALTDVYWVVLHDEEAPTAAGAANYFRSPSSGGSAHLCLDETVCYRCLANDVVPWGASSAPALAANKHGFHIEQAGYAAWLPGRWLVHRGTVERAAYKTALHLRVFKLPALWRTADDLVSGVRSGTPARGITTHREITLASKRLDPAHAWQYTHTDPGRFYPRALFMQRVRAFRAELDKETDT
jgi:hypothetical protein